MQNRPSLTCNDERKHSSNYRAYDVVVPQETFEQLGQIKQLPLTNIGVSMCPYGDPATLLNVHSDNGPKAVRPWLKDPAEMAYLVNQDPWGRPCIATIDQRAVYRRGESIQDWVKRAVAHAINLGKKGKLTDFDGILLDVMKNNQRLLENGAEEREFDNETVEGFAIRELAPCRQRQMVDALVAAVRKEILKWFAQMRGAYGKDRLLPRLNEVGGKTMASMGFGLEEAEIVTANEYLEGQSAGKRIRHLWMNRVISLAQMEIQRLLKEQLDVKGTRDGKSNKRAVNLSPADLALEVHFEIDVPDNELRVTGSGGLFNASHEALVHRANIESIAFREKPSKGTGVRGARRAG